MLYRVSKAHDDTLVSIAKTGLVFFDYEAKKVTSMPGSFKALFKR
jgi:acyl-CoA thioesterase FadM